MRKISIVLLSILALGLSACAAPTATPPIVVTGIPSELPPVIFTPQPYPYPLASQPAPSPHSVAVTPTTPISAYPAPGTPASGTLAIPLSGYEPQAGDESMSRDTVTLDLATSQLVVSDSMPAQVVASLKGDLPNPDHVLRVVVTPADAQNTINLEVYSLVPPGAVSTHQEKPFSVEIPLGSYANGDYTVRVNGELLGQFVASYAPQPGDEKLSRGEVSLDMASTQLVTSGKESNEPAVVLSGELPDPCHQLRIVVSPPDNQKKINVEVYSVFDPQTMCIMVIQPFQVTVPLGSYPSGHYSVYVNGQLLGEFDK